MNLNQQKDLPWFLLSIPDVGENCVQLTNFTGSLLKDNQKNRQEESRSKLETRSYADEQRQTESEALLTLGSKFQRRENVG